MSQTENSGDVLPYRHSHTIGDDNHRAFGLDFHHPVFAISSVSVIAFIAFTLAFPAVAADAFVNLRLWLTTNLDWFFMASLNLVLIFCVGLAFSPWGQIRIGGEDAQPQFGRLSWICMLFAAGIGIGIMFYGVLEPMNHALNPPLMAEGLSGEPLYRLALAGSIYHWSFHPWAVYALVGLALAYFCYNRGLPLLIRSTCYPIFGDRIWGWPGHCIDIIAVFATLFGLATSLGYGAEQASAGLHFLFGMPQGPATNFAVVAVITCIALVSLVRGLDGGIRRLSEFNMGLAAILGLFVLVMGPTVDILQHIPIYAGAYIAELPALSNWIGREDNYFMHDWTTFYWAWWIAFSPFVGMFIARISTGRSIREFIIVTLLAPSFIFLVWMTIFGHTALVHFFDGGVQNVADSVRNFQAELTLFVFLQEFPLVAVTSVIGIILVLIFFVTSMDSGSLVVDTMTAGGKTDTPLAQRMFWCIALGLIGISLLLGGGLASLQALALATALPFTVILLLMMISLVISLRSLSEQSKTSD
ncbi:MAG: BCCT family transporter [SAR116 cluster bacterium]|nr:MAG: BCCT family transporter [SAR116 cluster bacterium]